MPAKAKDQFRLRIGDVNRDIVIFGDPEYREQPGYEIEVSVRRAMHDVFGSPCECQRHGNDIRSHSVSGCQVGRRSYRSDRLDADLPIALNSGDSGEVALRVSGPTREECSGARSKRFR